MNRFVSYIIYKQTLREFELATIFFSRYCPSFLKKRPLKVLGEEANLFQIPIYFKFIPLGGKYH